MTEKVQGYTAIKPRFKIRKTDYAIVDNENKIAPIMVQMEDTNEDSQYADRSGVVTLLNQLNYEANNNPINLSVYDAVIGIERKLIFLEKIIKEINYIGRMNFKKSMDFNKQREEQFLIEIQNHYDRAFQEAYQMIRQAKEGLTDD